MVTESELLVSTSGRMSVPASVRRRWGLEGGGRITVFDLGDAIVLLPPGGRAAASRSRSSAEEHVAFVARLDDPDLATS